MKKSKKAGGYNLRKSLAWDKAFFTEEGVLDPEELSMITGMSHRDGLSVVDEEERDSLSIVSDVESGSGDMETTEESSVKEMSSSQASKTTVTTHVRKQDSSPGSHLRMISRSSQKIPTGQGLYKSAIKGACSTPRTPSQKRLLNAATPEVQPRNSKIPRVPLSKHPPLPFTTTSHAPSGGSQRKGLEIPQPAQKNISLKFPSNTKCASKGTNINSGGTSKSIKQLGTAIRMDTACSSLKINPPVDHKARSAKNVSSYVHNSSNHRPPVNLAESGDGRSKTKSLSNHQSDKGDGNKKDVQVQGIKLSGLRMPSPSMRFFSEGNMNSSNLKPSIPASNISEASDHIYDFKQIKARHSSLLHNTTSRKRLSSQVTEICSTSSLVDPTTHPDAMHGKVLQQVLLGEKVPQAKSDVKCAKNVLKDIDPQHSDESLSSLKDVGKDTKNSVFSSLAESANINSSDHVLQNGCTVSNTRNNSIASCLDVQPSVAVASNGEVFPAFDEDTGCTSSAMNNSESLRSVTDLNSHHNNYTLADGDSLTNMLCDGKTPGIIKTDDLGQFNSRDMNLQLDGCTLNADGKCPLIINGSDSAVPVRIAQSVVVENSDGDQQGSISGSEQMSSCSTKCAASGITYERVDKEQGDVMYDSGLSTVKLGECPVQQDNIGSKHVPCNKSSNYFSENRSSSTTSKTGGNKVNFDEGLISDHSRTSCLDLSNSNAAAQFLESPLPHQSAEKSPLSYGREKVDIGCQRVSLESFACGTEIAINRYLEVTQQVAKDDSVGKLPIAKRDNVDVSQDLLLTDSSLGKERKESTFEGLDDILQMQRSVDRVETHIDLVGNNNAFQTAELDAQLSASRNTDQATNAAVEPILDTAGSLCDRHELSARESMLSATLDIQSNKLDGGTCLEAPETNTFTIVNNLTVESKCNMERVDSSDEANANLKRTTDKLKVTIPASNAVPFSDEWLAAIESAGEDILTMKTGAVQHSPPDKAAPDPSPWSPVKRKTYQVIGPFDCTKCTKHPNPQLDPSE